MVRNDTARTPQAQQRRRNISDAATGVERFRVLVYLCTAPGTDSTPLRAQCEDYAATYGWTVADVIEDRAGLLPPQGREGLARAVDGIRERRAGALLTPYRSMISPRPAEYHEVAAQLEKAGGFLVAMTSATDTTGG